MRKSLWSKLFLPIMLIALNGFCCSAYGNEIKFTPFASLKQEYNDNIFLDARGKKRDFITTLSPGLELSDRSERLEAALTLRIHGILYARNDALNAVDQNFRGKLGYLLTPRTRLSATAAYIHDSRPDRDIETTGMVLADVKRHRQSYSFAAEYSLTEKTSLAVNYGYDQDDYDNDEFTDLRWHNAGLSLLHNMDSLMRNTRGSLNVGYAHYDFTGSTVGNISLTLGIDTSLTELWSVQAYAGARHTISEYETLAQVVIPPDVFLIPADQTSREWGWVGQLALSYRGETTNGSLSFSSDVKPSSGQSSGTTIRTGLIAEVRKRFYHELSGALAVSYYHNESTEGAFTGQRIDEDVILATPSIRYEFSRDMFVEASYRFTKLFDNYDSVEADRNIVFVRFSVQHPVEW